MGSIILVLECKIENRKLPLRVHLDSDKHRWRLDPAPSHSPLQPVTPVEGSSLQLDRKYVLWESCQSHRCTRSPLFLQGILCFWLFSRELSTTSSILVCKRLWPTSRKQCHCAVTAPSHDTACRVWEPSSLSQQLFWDSTTCLCVNSQIFPGGFTYAYLCNMVLLLLSSRLVRSK